MTKNTSALTTMELWCGWSTGYSVVRDTPAGLYNGYMYDRKIPWVRWAMGLSFQRIFTHLARGVAPSGRFMVSVSSSKFFNSASPLLYLTPKPV